MRGRIAGSLAGVVALSCPTACGTRVHVSGSPGWRRLHLVVSRRAGSRHRAPRAASRGSIRREHRRRRRASSPVPLSTRPAARPATLQGRPPSTRAPVTPAAPDRPVADTSSNHLAAMDGPGVSPPDRTVFPPAGQKSPLRLASVGTYSGPVGTVMLPMVIGAQVWVKYINAKGGLNGHQVELVVYDDGGDPARHRSQVQEAIERKKVVAFLQNGEGLTGRSSVDYVTGKRAPVIGSDTSQKYMYTSPMYFPQVTSGEAMLRTIPPSMASQVRPGEPRISAHWSAQRSPHVKKPPKNGRSRRRRSGSSTSTEPERPSPSPTTPRNVSPPRAPKPTSCSSSWTRTA